MIIFEREIKNVLLEKFFIKENGFKHKVSIKALENLIFYYELLK